MGRMSIKAEGNASSSPEAQTTTAQRHALRNWQANLRMLATTQPQLAQAIADTKIDVSWIYGRDGALTAMNHAGRWWAECSLPRRAAQSMLQKVSQQGTTGCFLSPVHGCQIETALTILRPEQALIAILPQHLDLLVALHCCDFSTDIEHHRLWFAAGEDWPEQLAAILSQNPGLPTPQQFIRTPLARDEDAAMLMQPAKRIIADITQRRADSLEQLRARPLQRSGRIGVMTRSHFRLWDNAAAVLAEVASQGPVECRQLDGDDPCAASKLAVAMMASECDAVLAANLTRVDLSASLGQQVPLITWLTEPRLSPFSAAGPRDGLILADPQWAEAAQQHGWPTDRIMVAAWPSRLPDEGQGVRSGHLAIIADTCVLEAEPELDLSSHQLLWQAIAGELHRNPFALSGNWRDYLITRMKQFGIGEQGMEWQRFLTRLILPAYQQGLARMLIAAGLPVRLHGQGWAQIADFAPHTAGPLRTSADLAGAVRAAVGLVHVWPATGTHPIDAVGRPIVRRRSGDRSAFLEEARQALTGRLKHEPAHPERELSAHRLVAFINALLS